MGCSHDSFTWDDSQPSTVSSNLEMQVPAEMPRCQQMKLLAQLEIVAGQSLFKVDGGTGGRPLSRTSLM